MAFHVYILRCRDGSYYTGHTDDLDRRIGQHRSGELGGYTAQRLPVELVFADACQTREDALAFELQIKRWSRRKKEALMTRDWQALRVAARKDFRNRAG